MNRALAADRLVLLLLQDNDEDDPGPDDVKRVGTVGMILKRSLIALAIFGALAIVILGLFKTIPSSFLPEEDQGYFITIVQLPEGASKTRTIEVLKKIENYFMANPAVHSTDVLAGQNFVFGTRGTNQATMFVPLQHWDTRADPSDQVPGLIAAALGEFAKIPEALILARSRSTWA